MICFYMQRDEINNILNNQLDNDDKFMAMMIGHNYHFTCLRKLKINDRNSPWIWIDSLTRKVVQVDLNAIMSIVLDAQVRTNMDNSSRA